MTALQLNAELYRAMGEIADNETLLAKVLAYVKGRRQRKMQDGLPDLWALGRMIVLLTRLSMIYAVPGQQTILISSYERLSS